MITISNLTKSYNKDKVILENINLKIENGKRVGIIGPSGCGKTTLLKCIGGLLNYDAGSILYDNEIDIRDKANKSFRQKIAFVFQDFGLFPNMTVLKNITFPLTYVRKIKKEEAIEIAKQKLSSLNILEKASDYPNHLSGGEKQRVAIARALALDPVVILFDEPTSALDPQSIKNFIEIINNIDRSITLIFVSHSLDFIEAVCDEVVFFDDNKIVEKGKTNKILKNPKSKSLKEFLNSLQIKNI